MHNIAEERGSGLNRTNLIEAILRRDVISAIDIIEDDPLSVNDVYESTGATAAMLITSLGAGDLFKKMISKAEFIDYRARDLKNRDLLDSAMSAHNPDVIDPVISAYRRYAPHIVNNWPEPE